MPPRPRSRRASPPVLIPEDEDIDFEVSYSEDDGGQEGGGSYSSSSEDGERSGEEEEEDEESVAEGCAAVERAADAPTCPVCMEPWTSDGEHRISCIPCGHVYGRSCLETWLPQHGDASATCPLCGRRFKHEDIIDIYSPEVVVPNDDLEKQLLSCRQKAESLEELVMKQGKELDEALADKNHKLTNAGVSKRQKIAGHLDGRTHLEPSASVNSDYSSSNSCRFLLLNEYIFDAGRVIILASGKAPDVSGEHVLTKISMVSCYEARTLHLPPDTKVVKDICNLPRGSALFASLGKRLSLFSMSTDGVVLQCNAPALSKSCSAHGSDSDEWVGVGLLYRCIR